MSERPDIISTARARLRDGALGGIRWRSALTADELPPVPHVPAVLSIVGVGPRAMLHDIPVKPRMPRSTRDLRATARALVAAPEFDAVVAFCESRGLTLLLVWRVA